jgi:hypothetical protein
LPIEEQNKQINKINLTTVNFPEFTMNSFEKRKKKDYYNNDKRSKTKKTVSGLILKIYSL